MLRLAKDSCMSEERKYRVFWQHLETYNSNYYPKQEPYFTLEEAKAESLKERQTGYLRS